MNQPPTRKLYFRPRPQLARICAGMFVVLVLAGACLAPSSALAGPKVGSPKGTPTTESSGGLALESAAAKASTTGRSVAMSLIGLAFAIAAIVLAFRRDFKEAGGVLLIGVLAVFLANGTGVSVLKETVEKLFGP
ncbi:MAG TPA: hypothetical protein VID48_12585 [Solirubrobacteraceae bacterium]|jgi:hypothetical protein